MNDKPRPVDVTLSGVHKRFGRRRDWVLNGVDLRLVQGATTLIVGANGTGKSTLLRVIGGLIPPTAGTVDTESATIAYAPDRLSERLRMTPRVYVAHMARLRGCDPRTVATQSVDLFERLGLAPGPDVPIRSLSKGNSQKVALVQALIAPVDVLLLDEPFGGLDPSARVAVVQLIAERSNRGAAVVVTAHAPLSDLENAHTLRLRSGRLVQDSAPQTSAVRIVLTGSPSASLVGQPGVIAVQHDAETTTLTVASNGSDALLGFALTNGWSVISVTPIAYPRGNGAPA